MAAWGDICEVSECKQESWMLKRFQMGTRTLLGTWLQGSCTAKWQDWRGRLPITIPCTPRDFVFAGLQFCVDPTFLCYTPGLSFGMGMAA